MKNEFVPIRTVHGVPYERIAIKTHLILFGEDLVEILKKYVRPELKSGDWIALSEKVVSVTQNNVRHISTVKISWLANLIVKGVKKYPDDRGWDSPEKMQLVVDMAGYPRTILAMTLGAIGKLFRVRGIFWRIVGHRLGEIDGFNPAVMYPYNEYAALPPLHPRETCADIKKHIGAHAVIIDGNNINIKVIAMSSGMPVDAAQVRLILLDNPMGQEREMTPFIIVRRKSSDESRS
ncbi:MAG: coenzyme F420-0:L-glutamate ligase [Minisyncoccota bacterium]